VYKLYLIVHARICSWLRVAGFYVNHSSLTVTVVSCLAYHCSLDIIMIQDFSLNICATWS